MSDEKIIGEGDILDRLEAVENAIRKTEETIRVVFEKIEPILAEVSPMLEKIERSPFGKMILGGRKS